MSESDTQHVCAKYSSATSCQDISNCSSDYQNHYNKQTPKSDRINTNNVKSITQTMDALQVSPQRQAVEESQEADDTYDSPSNHAAGDDVIGRTLPQDLPSHINLEFIMKAAGDIVSCLNQFGVAVVNKLLGPELGTKILEEAILLHDRHLMTDGQTIAPNSAMDTSQSRQIYRQDKISWVDGVEADCLNIGTLLSLLDIIMQHAKDKLVQYQVQGRTKAMVACYPGRGAKYIRHVDNPVKDGRLLTCIYYLNKDWNCRTHGGMLRIYPVNSPKVASIEPIMDRLIVFWSDARNPHEVLPAYKTRFAVTTWYFDAEERSRAMIRQ